MKKLYTLLAAAAVSVTAFAAPQLQLTNAEPRTESIPKLRTYIAENTRETAAKPLATTSPEFESYNYEFIGTGFYKASVMADYYGLGKDMHEVYVYEATDHPGFYRVNGVWGFTWADLYVDATDPDYVQVPLQNTYISDNVDGNIYIASTSWFFINEYGATKKQFLASYPELVPTLKDGVIKFAAETLCLRWPDASTQVVNPTDPTEYYPGISDGELILPGAEEHPWEDLGEGDWIENIIYPIFTGAENTTVQKAHVYYDPANQSYIIGNAFKVIYDTFNIGNTPPNLIIDASTPDNCIVGLTSTGLASEEAGLYSIYSKSQYYLLIGQSIDNVEKELRITATKENGTLTITFPYRSMSLTGTLLESDYYASPYTSTLSVKVSDASGVSAITADENAPVEYFNLQGMKVAQPENGLYIRRQGANTTKVLIK